jgi:hypothetical protein
MTTATGCTGDPNQHCGSCTAAAATSNCPAFCSSNQNTHWEIQGCVNGCCAITSTTVGPICTGNGGTTTPPVPGTATCPSTTATLPFTWTATGTNPSVNVQLCDANRNNCQQVPGAYTLPTGGQGATATGLTAGSTYTWNVTATANNNVSTTVWGNNITCGGGGTPTAPTNVSATCTGTNATVNFTLGQDNVNAYVYYCDKTTETTNTQCETWDRQPNGFQPPYGQPVSGSSANITVPNAGDTYAYFVRSCNGVNTLNATTCVDSTLGTSGNPPTFTCSSTPTVTGTISPTVTGAPSPTVTGTPTCTSGQTNPYFSCSGNTCVSNSSCGTNSGGCTAAGGSCNVQSGDTTLTFTIGLDGIGTTGDSVTTVSTGSNKNPNTPTRTLNVKLFDTTNKETDFTGTMTYDSNTSDSAYGLFTGTVDLGGSFTGGSYTVKVSTPGHLVRLIPGTQTITSGTTNAMPQVRLVAGDINSDNYINILDYNLLMSCSNDVNITNPDNGAACSQNANYAKNADLDDNGVVNSFDYNLFLREYSVQNGD